MPTSLFDKLINSPSALIDTITYATNGFWLELGDYRVASKYPLMSGGPIPIIAIVSLYLYFVRFMGPKMMKTRDPIELKWTIRIYNILMSLINLYTFVRVAIITRCGIDYFGCKKVDSSGPENEMVQLGFIYFATKIVELLDTIFFILRKKHNQASNLHVFHHSFIAICVWIYFKIAPGGSSVLFPFLNCGVHVIMYGYYFLATFPTLQKQLTWKRYLTLAQIIQFVLSMIHFSFQGLSSCQYPPALAIIGFIFNFVFFVLFIDFYRIAYLQKPNLLQQKKKSQATTTTTTNNNKLGDACKPLLSSASSNTANAITNTTTTGNASKNHSFTLSRRLK